MNLNLAIFIWFYCKGTEDREQVLGKGKGNQLAADSFDPGIEIPFIVRFGKGSKVIRNWYSIHKRELLVAEDAQLQEHNEYEYHNGYEQSYWYDVEFL